MGTVALIQVIEPDDIFSDTNDREYQIKDTGRIEDTYLYRTTGSPTAKV
jgi:regulatory protein YycH of two-component signal transduction system YycFG